MQYLLNIETFLTQSHRKIVQDHLQNVMLTFILSFLSLFTDIDRKVMEESALIVVDLFCDLESIN